MDMPWTDAREFAKAAAALERQRLFDLSVAMRAAQADEKGWKSWISLAECEP